MRQERAAQAAATRCPPRRALHVPPCPALPDSAGRCAAHPVACWTPARPAGCRQTGRRHSAALAEPASSPRPPAGWRRQPARLPPCSVMSNPVARPWETATEAWAAGGGRCASATQKGCWDKALSRCSKAVQNIAESVKLPEAAVEAGRRRFHSLLRAAWQPGLWHTARSVLTDCLFRLVS